MECGVDDVVLGEEAAEERETGQSWCGPTNNAVADAAYLRRSRLENLFTG